MIQMKLKHYLLLLFTAALGTLNAQSLAWHENIGSRLPLYHHNQITITQIESDSQYIYVLGGFEYLPLHFQQSGRNLAFGTRNINAFLAQYTQDGILRWVKMLGSYNFYIGYKKHRMALSKGQIYLTGVLFQQGWLGNDSLTTDRANVYLAKFDNNGNKIWHKLSSPTFWADDSTPKSILINEQEQIYITGEQRGFRPLIFDSLATQIGARQFVFKFDSTGKPLQAVSANATDLSTGWGFNAVDSKIDTHNNFWLLLSDGSRNTFSACAFSTWRIGLYRITPQGQMDSITSIHCNDLMTGTALSIAENGDMYIAGRYRGQLTLGGFKSEDKGCVSPTAFLARVTQKGELVWFRTGNAAEFSDIYQLKTEKDGNLLVMGVQQYEYRKSNEKFRYPNYPSPYPNGESRIFIKRMSPYGAAIDSIQFYTHDFRANEGFNPNICFTQSPQGDFFMGMEYYCKLDTFSHTLCEGWTDTLYESAGSKLLVGRLNNKLLQKKQFLPPVAEKEWRIFPNPTTGFLFVQSNSMAQEPIIATIYDMNGHLVQEVTYDKNSEFILMNLENHPAGIYLLAIRNHGNLLFSTKIVRL